MGCPRGWRSGEEEGKNEEKRKEKREKLEILKNKNFSENIFMKKFNIFLTFTLWVFPSVKLNLKYFTLK